MIGIYGGTFDPIHYGHLRTAVDVKQALGLAELRLLPCGTPAHRNAPVASAWQRKRMIELALEFDGEPGLCLDDRELRRDGPSYMVDTLRSLREDLPDTSVCLIVGADAFLGLDRWSRWETLFELAHVVVMGRPETKDVPLRDALAAMVAKSQVTTPDCLRRVSAGHLLFVPVTQLAISATRIRELVKSGASARYLLPGHVLEFIEAEGLYR